MYVGTCWDQKRELEPLELELQAFVTHLTWVLVFKAQSSCESTEDSYLLNHFQPDSYFWSLV